MENKQLLIFDFDGTLIDSVPDLADATNKMLEQLGKPTYSLDTIKQWVGNGARMLVKRALSGSIEVDKDLAAFDIEEATRLFYEAYAAPATSKTTAYPDVDSGLRQLKEAGYTLALVTNKPMRFVPKILEIFGWTPLFNMVLGGDSLATKKPDPAPLLHVCKTLKFDPKQAVMIGDSTNDIYAGQGAGIDTIGLSYGYNYGKDISESNPNLTFNNFAALIDYLLK